MNRDDIIRMAREHLVKCEYTEFGWQECYRYEFDDDELLHFAALVAAAEREACVEVCDNLIRHGNVAEVQQRYNKAYEQCKDAIRARGNV